MNEFILWWKELTGGYKFFFLVVFFLVIFPLLFEFIMNTYYKNNYWSYPFSMENTTFVTEKGDEVWFYQTRSCDEPDTEKVDKRNCVKGVKVADLTKVSGRKDEAEYLKTNRLSTAILKDKNSFVWSENNKDLKSVKIYLSVVNLDTQTVQTTLLKEIVKFDLDKYYQDIQKGVAQPISSIQNQTGVIYDGRYKYDSEQNTISWVDAMVTEKDNKKPTEAISRLNTLELNYSSLKSEVMGRERENPFMANLFLANPGYGRVYHWSLFGSDIENGLEKDVKLISNVQKETTWNTIVDYSSQNLTISSTENHYIGRECRDSWNTMPCYLWGSTVMKVHNLKTGYKKTFVDGRVVMHKLGNHTTLSELSVVTISQDEEKLILQKNRKNYFLDMTTGKRNIWTANIGKIHNFE